MSLLNILVIPAYKLFPIESGGAHGQLSFLDKLQFQHNIDILITPDNIEDSDIPLFQKRFPNLNIIKASEKKASGFSGVRQFFIKEKRKISGKDSAYAFRKTKHLSLLVFNTPEMVHLIADITTRKQYDIVQIEHTRNISLIEAVKGNSKKIFVHHEIYFHRVLQDMLSLNYDESYSHYISNAVQAMEIYWLKKYDGIITFNIEDTDRLVELEVKAPQQIAKPLAFFEDELDLIYNSEAEQKLAFIGGEAHYPNKQGIIWFIENVYPKIIAKFPSIVLEITGNWSKEFQQQMGSKNIRFLGFVDDLNAVFQSSIMIVPVKIGSGIKIKTITAMAKGMPIVTTTHGAEGIPGAQDGENIFLADQPEAFANGVLHLLENKDSRERISKNVFGLAKRIYQENDIASHRAEFYSELINSGTSSK